MTLWTPKSNVKVIHNGGLVGSSSPFTGVTSNATTLLDGAVTELISAAANNQDSWGIEIWITATGSSATASEGTIDILVGGATDDVLIDSLIAGYRGISAGEARYFFPIFIPAGTRIAATHANVRVSQSARVGCFLYGGSPPPFRVGRKVTTYGTKINNARGQLITPAASGGAALANQLTASTTEDHFYFMPGFQAATDNTLATNGYVNVGIGIGAATEERIGSWWFALNTTETMFGPMPSFGAFREVPAGTRLTMLSSNSVANDAAYDGLIYAVS